MAKILHKRSTGTTAPDASILEHGELAINYRDGNEALHIKNSAGKVIAFKSEEYNAAQRQEISNSISALEGSVASALKTGHTLTLSGDCSGSVTLANGNMTLNVTAETAPQSVSKNVVSGTAAGTGNTTTSNSKTYLNHLEDSSVTSSNQIVGSGTVTVTSDQYGKIIITGEDTNSHHQAKLVSASATTSTASTTDSVNGVYINLVENGEVRSNTCISGGTGISVTSPITNIIEIANIASTDYVPLSGFSTSTKITNLDADLLDGWSGSGYMKTGHTITLGGNCSGSVTLQNSGMTLDVSVNDLSSNVNAGSATKPCYISEGKHYDCTYSLNKDVPNNAIFTDENVKAEYDVSRTFYIIGHAAQNTSTATAYKGTVAIKEGDTLIAENIESTNGAFNHLAFDNGNAGWLSDVYPFVHNLYNIGTDTVRWKSGYFESALYAKGGFYQKSDERKKIFQEEITVDFEKLKTIPKAYYTWIDDEEKIRNIGTSAQKVHKVYPELTNISPETGEMSVDYTKLSIVSLKAIDILKEENDALKKEINTLKEEIEKIKMLLNNH